MRNLSASDTGLCEKPPNDKRLAFKYRKQDWLSTAFRQTFSMQFLAELCKIQVLSHYRHPQRSDPNIEEGGPTLYSMMRDMLASVIETEVPNFKSSSLSANR